MIRRTAYLEVGGFFEPYFLDSDWSSSVELYDNLLVFPDFARSLGLPVVESSALAVVGPGPGS